MMHLRDKPAPLVGPAAAAARASCMRALEKDAGRRQQSAEALDTRVPAVPGRAVPAADAGAVGSVPIVQAQPEMRTMMAQEAPKIGTRPGCSGPRHGGMAEQKTMMAQEAPRLGGAPAHGGMAEQKTMMAQEAPKLGGAGAPAGSEQRTMMAMEAPKLGGAGRRRRPRRRRMAHRRRSTGRRRGMGRRRNRGAAAGRARPRAEDDDGDRGAAYRRWAGPAAGRAAAAGSAARSDGRQQHEDDDGAGGAVSSSQKTMMAQQAPGIGDGSTKILPDSAGVIAYATERARQARHSAEARRCGAAGGGAVLVRVDRRRRRRRARHALLPHDARMSDDEPRRPWRAFVDERVLRLCERHVRNAAALRARLEPCRFGWAS